MKVAEKTIASVAEEMYQNMESRVREDGSTFICCKDDIQWQRDIIHAVHGDRLPDDTIYNQIHDFLNDFRYSETEDDCQQSIMDTEADCYTSDLTAWLNERNDHVYYLTQALEEFDIKDGFQALAYAQKLYIDEIGYSLLSEMQKYIDSL